MSFRLRLLNLALRLVEKPHLARARDVAALRRRLERAAEFWFAATPGASFHESRIGGVRVLEAMAGRADRRRILVWFHGGAYLQGSPETHRRLGAALSARTGTRVILPDYRLAPEHVFPAPVEDARAVWEGLVALGHVPGRIALGGDSAGGGLAFALLHLLGQAGVTPACALAFSPWADLTLSGTSLRRNARRDPMLPAGRLAEVRDRYLAGADPADPRASPARAAFRAPPPALIQTSRSEIVHDDAVALARRLREAGGTVRLEIWPDTPHAWQLFHGRLPEADAALASASAFLAAHLGPGGAEAASEALTEPAWS